MDDLDNPIFSSFMGALEYSKEVGVTRDRSGNIYFGEVSSSTELLAEKVGKETSYEKEMLICVLYTKPMVTSPERSPFPAHQSHSGQANPIVNLESCWRQNAHFLSQVLLAKTNRDELSDVVQTFVKDYLFKRW